MKITLEHMQDNEDGSSDVLVHMDDAGKMFLLSLGINESIRMAVEQLKITPAQEVAGHEPPPWDAPLTEQEQEAEDKAWEEIALGYDLQRRNRAALAAWNAAADFIAKNADRLGKISLREAFEKGFMQGYEEGKS